MIQLATTLCKKVIVELEWCTIQSYLPPQRRSCLDQPKNNNQKEQTSQCHFFSCCDLSTAMIQFDCSYCSDIFGWSFSFKFNLILVSALSEKSYELRQKLKVTVERKCPLGLYMVMIMLVPMLYIDYNMMLF